MVADHEHVEMLVDGVGSERTCRISRRRQNVGFTWRDDVIML